MTGEERRRQLVEYLAERGIADLAALMAHLDVSESTVRRDLAQLEEEGQIRRTHGGAVFVSERFSALNYAARESTMTAEKGAIGRAAAELVRDGEAILLDGGTTTFQVARHLKGRELQIVTNSLPIAALFASKTAVELVFVGGYIYPRTGVALGPLTRRMLESVHVNKAIMGAAGITQEGLFNANVLMVEAERQMMTSADEVIIVADHSKFGKRALAQLCPLGRVSKLICDGGLAEEWRQIVRKAGVELIVVEAGQQTEAPSEGR